VKYLYYIIYDNISKLMLGTTKQNRILVYSVTIVSYYAPIILNYKKIKIKKNRLMRNGSLYVNIPYY